MSKRSKKAAPTVTEAESEAESGEQPTVTPELSKEQREFLDAMNSLIMSAQELSYALALLPNELIEKHQELKELVESARNVVRATWRFHKLIKQRTRR